MFGVEGRDGDVCVCVWVMVGFGCVYNGGCCGASFIIFTCNVKERVLAGHLVTEFWDRITGEQIIFS